MDIPNEIKRHHARNHNRPYPCGYCFNYGGNADNISRGNLVKSFANGDMCNGGLRCPTGNGECERFYPTALDYRRHCIPEVFELLQREYLMYVISEIYEHPGILMKEAVSRSKRGYNARRERIIELIALGYVERLTDVHNEDILYCTAMGDKLAMSVRSMYENIVLVFQEDDIMRDGDVRSIFDFIHHNRRCTAYDIYKKCDSKSIATDGTDPYVALQELLDASYIDAEYDTNDWTICYDITERGLRAYDRENVEMQ